MLNSTKNLCNFWIFYLFFLILFPDHDWQFAVLNRSMFKLQLDVHRNNGYREGQMFRLALDMQNILSLTEILLLTFMGWGMEECLRCWERQSSSPGDSAQLTWQGLVWCDKNSEENRQIVSDEVISEYIKLRHSRGYTLARLLYLVSSYQNLHLMRFLYWDIQSVCLQLVTQLPVNSFIFHHLSWLVNISRTVQPLVLILGSQCFIHLTEILLNILGIVVKNNEAALKRDQRWFLRLKRKKSKRKN